MFYGKTFWNTYSTVATAEAAASSSPGYGAAIAPQRNTVHNRNVNETIFLVTIFFQVIERVVHCEFGRPFIYGSSIHDLIETFSI